MQKRRSYDQNCPIAMSLDLLGERWTLLILRELLGGPRRYGDLRAELPGIATNLLADRLRELEASGLIERTVLPAPIARTVYSLSARGWEEVLPILQALARFGLPLLSSPRDDEDVSPLIGFLAGILLAFDSTRAHAVNASYRADIDGRTFDFAVRDGRLAAAAGTPTVQLTARARDLMLLRLDRAATPIRVDGDVPAVTKFRGIFALG